MADPNNSSSIHLKDIRHGMKNLYVNFIILEIGKPTHTKDGHDVRTVKIADKTGSMNMSVWDQVGEALQIGDICKLLKGYCGIWKNALTLYTGKSGEIWKWGEFTYVFNEHPNYSEVSVDVHSSAYNKDGPPPQLQHQRKEGNDDEEGGNSHHRMQHPGQGPGSGNGGPYTQRMPRPPPPGQNRGPSHQPGRGGPPPRPRR